MRIFAISDAKLSAVEPLPFLERQIQTITEKNLEMVFGLQFICSELPIGAFRVDTVAFDPGAFCFVLIEYKKGQSFSIIDQGYAYLSTLQRHKADLVLKYNETMGASLGKEAFNWDGSRVIFVSPVFTEYQREAGTLGDLPLELCEVHLYSNDTIGYSMLQERRAPEVVQAVARAEAGNVGTASECDAAEETVLEGRDEAVRQAYYAIVDIVRTVCPGAEARVRKSMVGFYAGGRGLVWAQPGGRSITLHLRKGVYRDRYGAVKPNGWGGYPEIRLPVDNIDLEYVRDLVSQARSN